MNPRLADFAHKSVVLTCVAASAWGLYGIYIMHNERLRAGKEALAKHEMEQLRVMREGNNGRVLESETLQSRLQRPQ